ncbi:hybrid histidine kinase/response regulator HrmK [Halotia branconii]|uniref:Circadian input-output histidine kinase CikA n=1 Tax=Halotia branconii CENA392 TaxID=1539056 RepID=A0AAJ6NVU6_9CYAN|nr:hybrid histidine kinase/response regulator HrmK [Halotia branconii]WGV27673.1 hybrid histidine kinase/response regulator HrmK [Halotia branconii CENA392]
MQQYSSLPEQNSQIDITPTPLIKIQQLRTELWLERSLNRLQNRLNDCLLGAGDTGLQVKKATETEIFQIVVQELDIALNNSKVAIALFQPEKTVAQVCCVSRSPSLAEVMPKKAKQLPLRLQELIELKDLQQLENQQPPSAWRLTDAAGGVIGWIIVTTISPSSDCKTVTALETQLRSQLITKSVQHCINAITQLRQIQYWQQQSEQLDKFNQQLERTNQLKNQFLANTSHEIRTPLSSIIGFTQLLLAQGYEPSRERHQEYLNIIQSSGKHLLALINDILDLSKIEANQLEVQWEIVNVPDLCRNVLALVKEKAANKGLKLCLEIDSDITTLVADSLRLKQMLLNLLFNALKFTSTGTVGLQVINKGLFVHFRVWDTGIGISQEDQKQLFKPYFQIANSVANRSEGTGLGLVVTQKLAEIHNGYVEVESEVNHGSRFTIILPLTPFKEVVKNEIKIVEIVDKITSYSLKILLVEDDLPNGQLMQSYLNKLGYQVTWVNNAVEMWQALTQINPAVILMDVKLSDENGLNLVQQLRENQQYYQIPVIAQTAMAMKGDRETCLGAGVNDYISKPIDLPLLASLVAKYSQLPKSKSSEDNE